MREQQVKESLGIDISKLTIDAGLHHRGLHEQFTPACLPHHQLVPVGLSTNLPCLNKVNSCGFF